MSAEALTPAPPNAADEALWVTGGAGGQRAVAEDLEEAARAIADAATMLGWVSDDCLRQSLVAEDAMVDASPGVLPAARDAAGDLDRVAYGPGGSRSTADALDHLATRLTHVAQGFVEAERAAMDRMSGLDLLGARYVDGLGAAVWLGRAATGVVWRWSPLGFLAHGLGRDPIGDAVMPDGPPPTSGYLRASTVQGGLGVLDAPVVGPFPGAIPSGHSYYSLAVLQLAQATAILDIVLGEERRSASALKLADPAIEPPRGVADLIHGLQRAHEDKDGSVGITEVVQADGTSAFVVSVPGTETWVPGVDNPADPHASLAITANAMSDRLLQTVDAMAAAGIPADAPVMLVGHSQGGMLAMQMAGSATLATRFNVTHVVTAGSPAGRAPVPSDVQQLHLQHPADVVHALDGHANADSANVVTVSHDLRGAADPEIAALGRNAVGAHGLDVYEYTARVVDSSANASVGAFTDSARAFLGGESATYREYVAVPSSALSPCVPGGRPS